MTDDIHRYSDQFAMHTLNPISQSTLSSPSPSTRDVPQRTVHGKDPSRSRFQAYPYYDGSPLAFGKIYTRFHLVLS